LDNYSTILISQDLKQIMTKWFNTAGPCKKEQKGLFVIGQPGDNLVILNDDKFKPHCW